MLMNLRRKIEEEEMAVTEGFCLGLQGTGRDEARTESRGGLPSVFRVFRQQARDAGKEQEEQTGDA